MVAINIAGLRKTYGGIVAVEGMDLDVASGTIHAIVGENGAGKSTLMKALAGAIRPDAGSISIDGQAVELASARAARENGIGIVYQELSILPDRPLLANLFVNREPTRFGLVATREMERRARPVLARLGLDVDLAVPVGSVSIAERQLIELARVLLQHPSVLILDEPNSALNDRETQRLFAILRELAGEGITVLYVSHRLEEVFQIADRVTVMRDGREILTRDTTALTIPEVVEAMVGTKQEDLFPERTGSVDAGGASLVVDGLSVGTGLTDVSFEARPGEIVGLAGIAGSGIELLLGTLFGERRASTGTVRYPDGGPLPTSPTRAARRRVSLVPADRRTQGLMLDRSVASNVVQVAVGAMPSINPWLSRRATDAVADRQIGRLGIKTAGPSAPVSALSGGNQQKVVLAKWLEVSPTVVLLDDPTRGVDVGAKHEIYALVRQLADSGRIVLLRSTELPEIIGLADRILVFYRGRLATECPAADVTTHDLLRAVNTGAL
ncbi:MAG TPA: sugar ABC transporter ATP-binding protein [Desertimonas sp.]|nr:sugar ABC transporter ATP-binding protein [Desertimonas sp.]